MTGSGFQSFQFRMMEIRFGVIDELRITYNKKHFADGYPDDQKRRLLEAMQEPSLLNLIDDWLSRTPGLKTPFGFWNKFKVSVQSMLEDMKADLENEEDENSQNQKWTTYEKTKKNFSELFDENNHNDLLKKHERRLSYPAMQGALMISFYRDEPRFHFPFQLLQSLMELDKEFMKIRTNHAAMVQMMVGTKVGSGGSSGYMYLRSTCSDRYKIFLDLLNLSTYLVPRDRIPPLDFQMKRSLSISDVSHAACLLPNIAERESGYTTDGACSRSHSEDVIPATNRSPAKSKRETLL